MKWWDRSWNPLCGCSACSEGCKNCVALSNLRKQGRSSAPVFNSKAFYNNLRNNINYMVCSLGDIFHPKHECGDIDSVFEKMAKKNSNRYFVETKYTAEMLDYFSDEKLPLVIRNNKWEHLWMGVSVESNKYLYRIDELLETPIIKHRFINLEPLLEEISISKYLATGKIEWVIIGAEVGNNARKADPEWFRKIIKECRQYNVPVYISQVDDNSEPIKDINELPEEFRIQEIPWKNMKFDEFNKSYVLNGIGFVGYKRNQGKLEFHIKAPEYVYRYWIEKFDNVGNLNYVTPLTFAPQPNLNLKRAFGIVHSIIIKNVKYLEEHNVSKTQISKLLTSDVMVQFRWIPENFDNESIFEDNDNKDINLYLKTVKQIFNKEKQK